MKSAAPASLLSLALGIALASAAVYEGPRSFRASEILRRDEIKGPHYDVGARVPTPGFFHEFSLTTDYGNLDVESRSLLTVRIDEVRALAELDSLSRSEVFLRAAGESVVRVGKGFVSLARAPEATARGIGGGLKRLGTNLGRKASRAADKAVDRVTSEDRPASSEQKSTSEKLASGAQGVAHSVFGVNGAARRWAQKVGADPYTSNPVLKKALIDVGRVDAAGGIAARMVVPIPAIVSTGSSVGNLVWAKDPEELLKENEAKLASAGVAAATIRQLNLAEGFTLTLHTRLADAVSRVKVPGIADYVAAAARARTEREALLFVESAEQLSRLCSKQPVAAVLADSRALVAKTSSGRTVVILPVDYLRWTAEVEKAVTEIAKRVRPELGAASVELQIAGRASALAKKELAARRWQLVEHVPTTADILTSSAARASTEQ